MYLHCRFRVMKMKIIMGLGKKDWRFRFDFFEIAKKFH
jgi:hypothetical protein